MREVAPSRRWTRAVAGFALALVLRTSVPARAQEAPPPPEPAGSEALSLPAPGTHRLIRIGPQALVMEDDQGHFKMVDEPTPKPKARQNLAAMAKVFGILGAGAFIVIETQDDVGFDLGRGIWPH